MHLTPSLLETFGFEKTETYGNTSFYLLKAGEKYEIEFQFVNDTLDRTWLNDRLVGNKIDTLEKLQDLYFNLVCKQLKEKESVNQLLE
jgi:hypothetical protein